MPVLDMYDNSGRWVGNKPVGNCMLRETSPGRLAKKRQRTKPAEKHGIRFEVFQGGQCVGYLWANGLDTANWFARRNRGLSVSDTSVYCVLTPVQIYRFGDETV